MPKRKQETGMDRLRKIALWQWGLIVMSSGAIANVVMGLQASQMRGAAARGAQFGRGAATILFMLIGIGLIIAHFVRRKR